MLGIRPLWTDVVLHLLEVENRGVLLEHEVDFADGDEIRERRQLVENLPCLRTAFAGERLREEQQPHRPVHLRERFAQPLLIRRGDQGHEPILHRPSGSAGAT